MGLIPHARSPEGWMSVYVTNNAPDAYIVVGRLETEGIRSWVQQEAAGAALGLTVGQMGAVQVLVNPEDYEPAMAILAVDYSDEDWLEDGMDGENEDDDPGE
jgi:hypothetical protein